MAMTRTGSGGPNRLFWALMGISASVHFLIIYYGSGFHHPEIIIPIELSLRHSEPPRREIPRIPIRSQRPEAPRRVHRLTVRPVPVVPAQPVAAAAVRPSLPPKPANEIVAPKPEPLIVPGLRVAKWVPESVRESASKRPAAAGPEEDPAARDHYLNTIRGLIERQKRYPRVARRRQLQGKVIVEFVLTPSGEADAIRVVEECRFGILNRAAVEAVKNASPYPKPPPGLFSGNLSLRVPIVFELI